MNSWAAVPVAVYLKLFQSVGVVKTKRVQIAHNSMVGNFSNIVFSNTIVTKLVDLTHLPFIILTVFINFSDFSSVLVGKDILI